MSDRLLLGTLVIAGCLALHGSTRAHGGSYRGPGDTVPPAGGGGGGGGSTPTGPGPGGAGSGQPAGPTNPGTGRPGGATGGPTRRPGPVVTGSLDTTRDLTTWEFWWGFNKDRYLNLKAALFGGVFTGSDDHFLGSQGRDRSRNSLAPSEETIRTRVLPALRAALARERNNDIVTACLIALARIGDSRTEDGGSESMRLIASFLPDANQEIAETAALALGILGHDASVGLLSHLARGTPEGREAVGNREVGYRTRAFGAYALGLIGNQTASNEIRQQIAGVLIGLLEEPRGATRDVQVAALIGLGLVPIDVDLSEGPASDGGPVASRQAQIRCLLAYFDCETHDPLIRAHAPRALARLLEGAPAGLAMATAERLMLAVGRFSKEGNEVQQGCVLALGLIGECDQDPVDVEIRATLARVAEHGDQQSRNFAMIALGQIGGRGSWAAGRESCREVLLAHLLEGRNAIRPWAALGLGVMENSLGDHEARGATGVLDALRTMLRDARSPSLVGAYAIACGIARDTEARETLRARLADAPGDEPRGYVAVALGLVDAREAVAEIAGIVRGAKYRPGLLEQAVIGLGLLGDKDVVPDLVRMLSEAKGLSSQAAIASALGFIGDARSIDPLLEMLDRKEITDSARGFAVVALGIVADKEPLPWSARISADINYRASTTTLTGENSTGILDIL